MNDLYLIGNGFDLAHRLETSYNHFLLWYLNDFFKNAFRKDHYEDDLLKIDRQGLPYNLPSDFSSIKDISQKLKDLDYRLKAKHDFLGGIIENCRDYKWVDIEYEYYMALVDIYKRFEKTGLFRDKNTDKELESLNKCFDLIREKLVEYLNTIEITEQNQINHIGKKLKEYTGIDASDSGKKLILNFNYTSTIDLYYNWDFNKNVQLIHIHGKLNDKSNPIIFGYGDEIDGYYNKMKQLNQNDFLVNMKLFDYLKTKNYQDLMSFINSDQYAVKIMGHSCGVSDRVLLNKIFEHPNCVKIKIFFHEKENGDDFSEKVKDISRHIEKKSVLDLVCERGISEPLIPYQEQNISVATE
jgi:hypothetical protein